MGSLDERIKEIEEEIRITPKNKATETHLAKLKSKLAALRELASQRKSGRKTSTICIKKQGDATVSMVGLPSVGKSSLLNVLSNADSKIGEYAFTTTTLIPGMMFYKGAYIQLFDLPGIVEQASYGRGRGKEILSYARVSDLILLVIDVTKDIEYQLSLIKKELHNAGFRINRKKPDISITKRSYGGLDIFISPNVPLIVEDVKEVCHDFDIHNAEIVIRDANDLEDVYDAFFGNRVYVKGVVVLNKIDRIDRGNLRRMMQEYPDWVFVSAKTEDGICYLKERIFNSLDLIRIYTKKPLQKLDEVDKRYPLILRRPAYIKDVVERLKLINVYEYARVWGHSAKYPGQKVGYMHELQDGDIVEIVTK